MIRFVADRKNGEFLVDASGGISEVLADLGCCVSLAYNLIRSRNAEAAENFKRGFFMISCPDSPVWDKEDVPDPQNEVKIVRVKDMSKEVPHE